MLYKVVFAATVGLYVCDDIPNYVKLVIAGEDESLL